MEKLGEAVRRELELERLARAAIAGFDDGAGCYCALSGGWGVYRAPENYCTVKVAEKLADADPLLGPSHIGTTYKIVTRIALATR